MKSHPYTRVDYRPNNDGVIHFTFEWWHLWILKRFQYVTIKIELVWKSIQHRLVSNRKSMHYACNKDLIEVTSHMPKSVTCKKNCVIPFCVPHYRLFLLTLSSLGVDSLSVERREITSATMVLRKYLQTFILYIFYGRQTYISKIGSSHVCY